MLAGQAVGQQVEVGIVPFPWRVGDFFVRFQTGTVCRWQSKGHRSERFPVSMASGLHRRMPRPFLSQSAAAWWSVYSSGRERCSAAYPAALVRPVDRIPRRRRTVSGGNVGQSGSGRSSVSHCQFSIHGRLDPLPVALGPRFRPPPQGGPIRDSAGYTPRRRNAALNAASVRRWKQA